MIVSSDECASGLVRRTYRHAGIPGPTYPLHDLTDGERGTYGVDYVACEMFPGGRRRFWTQKQLDSVGRGCGAETTIASHVAAMYARAPAFLEYAYCATCRRRCPTGADGELVWLDGSRVGT